MAMVSITALTLMWVKEQVSDLCETDSKVEHLSTVVLPAAFHATRL